MRTLGAAILATSLFVSSAFAATTTNSAPLAPGKAAGVKEAQMHGNLGWWLLGAGVVGLGIALVASGNGKGGVTTATTTTTSP